MKAFIVIFGLWSVAAYAELPEIYEHDGISFKNPIKVGAGDVASAIVETDEVDFSLRFCDIKIKKKRQDYARIISPTQNGEPRTYRITSVEKYHEWGGYRLQDGFILHLRPDFQVSETEDEVVEFLICMKLMFKRCSIFRNSQLYCSFSGMRALKGTL